MSSSTILLDHFPPSEQLCYVQCTICQTLLAVSVPSTSLYNTVTVRCGHCNYLLPLNMRPFTFPSSSFFSPHNLLDKTPNMSSNFLRNEGNVNEYSINEGRGVSDEVLRPPVTNRQENLSLTYSAVQFSTPEKRQRVPSAYNHFIKDEIQRIKAGNPDISHREAFSAAAKNWAHFPHIHFGLMPDQTVKRTNLHQQEGDDVLMRDAFYASANVGVSPY